MRNIAERPNPPPAFQTALELDANITTASKSPDPASFRRAFVNGISPDRYVHSYGATPAEFPTFQGKSSKTRPTTGGEGSETMPNGRHADRKH
jgi:hypothetical protein